MSPDIRVISLKPIYAQRIIEGSKSIELRRRNLGITYGDVILIYETAPASMICGAFIAGKTLRLSPQGMWDKYRESLGIDRELYDAYLDQSGEVFGTEVIKAFSLPDFKLDDLTTNFPGFIPPQSTLKWKDEWGIPKEWDEPFNMSRQLLTQKGLLSQQLQLFCSTNKYG